MRNLELEREILAQPVHSLQYMLRRLSMYYDVLPSVVVDGVFGEDTLEAVMVFQREFAPPVTGVVDYGTWDAIHTRWEDAERDLQEPRALRAFPGNRRRAQEEGSYYFMAVPQTMFQVLSRLINGISPSTASGMHDELSAENVRWLQEKAGLPVTGTLDQRTWDALSRLYEVFVVPDHLSQDSMLQSWG